MASYDILPSQAKHGAAKPYTISVPDEDVERLRTLVKLSNVASPSYENSLPDGSRDMGLRREWLVEAKKAWEEEFDWKSHEKYMNSFPNFKAAVPVDGSPSSPILNIHFVALFSQYPSASPIVLLHGWPGSFLEFLPMLSLIRSRYPDPSQLPFHVIVPSLPGYTLSDAPPLDSNFDLEDVARMMDYLMVELLGLPGYVVQAGDVGSRVARILSAQFPHCPATLLNFSNVPAPDGFDMDQLTDFEKQGLKRRDWFKSVGSAYSLFQGTRPATLGLVLSSNPLALLAWVAEKFLDWTDPASFPALETLPGKQKVPYSRALMNEVLLSASLYWLSGKAHTCFYSYREEYGLVGGKPAKSHATPEYRIQEPKKLGFSYFPMEIDPTPRSFIEATANLVFWRQHDKGGHFAAVEQTDVLLNDLEEFVKLVHEK